MGQAIITPPKLDPEEADENRAVTVGTFAIPTYKTGPKSSFHHCVFIIRPVRESSPAESVLRRIHGASPMMFTTGNALVHVANAVESRMIRPENLQYPKEAKP